MALTCMYVARSEGFEPPTFSSVVSEGGCWWVQRDSGRSALSDKCLHRALGTTATTFEPGLALNRGQLATFLWRLAGAPTGSPPNTFVDVPPGAFFEQAVNWMVAQDPPITQGTTDTTFSPYDTVTRGQVATFFHRYKGTPAVAVDPASPPCGLTNPGDSKDCSDFATQSDAQAWYDTYFPTFGDVAGLDADGDGTACEEPPPPPPPPPSCHPAYSPCLPNLAGDALNCGDLTSAQKPVTVLNPAVDPYNLDGDATDAPVKADSQAAPFPASVAAGPEGMVDADDHGGVTVAARAWVDG